MVNKQVREVTTAEFGDLVNGEWPILADFYGTWCGPFKAMEPVIERLAKRFAGCAEVVKVNIDESRELAAAHAVRGVPTFLLFVARKAVERVVGASCEHSLAAPARSAPGSGTGRGPAAATGMNGPPECTPIH